MNAMVEPEIIRCQHYFIISCFCLTERSKVLLMLQLSMLSSVKVAETPKLLNSVYSAFPL